MPKGWVVLRSDSLLAMFFSPKRFASRVFVRNTVIEGLFRRTRLEEQSVK
jgi:hypothetical protein